MSTRHGSLRCSTSLPLALQRDVALAVASQATYGGNVNVARQATERVVAIERQVLQSQQDWPPSHLFLGNDVSKSIGHIGLQAWALHVSNGSGVMDHPPIVQTPANVANEYLQELCLSPKASTDEPSPSRSGLVEMTPLINPLRSAPTHTYDAISAGIHENVLGRMQMPPEGIDRGEAFLQNLGFSRRSPFVGVHLRVLRGNAEQSRNVNTRTYSRAIDTILDAGFQVVQMGKHPAHDVTAKTGYLNLTKLPYPATLDAFILSQCAFFFGTASGPYIFPSLFGVPCLVSDISSFAFSPDYPKTVHVPRRVVSKSSGSPLPLHLALERGLYRGDLRETEEYSYVDIPAEELEQAVLWMLEHFNELDPDFKVRINLDTSNLPHSLREPLVFQSG